MVKGVPVTAIKCAQNTLDPRGSSGFFPERLPRKIIVKVLDGYGGYLQIELATICQSILLDLFSLGQHLLRFSGIDICRSDIVDGFMVALIVVVIHKFANRFFEFAG